MGKNHAQIAKGMTTRFLLWRKLVVERGYKKGDYVSALDISGEIGQSASHISVHLKALGFNTSRQKAQLFAKKYRTIGDHTRDVAELMAVNALVCTDMESPDD